MKKYTILTYGCQMNKYDSELVASILNDEGYQPAKSLEESDLILLNTCSVREHAEARAKGKIDSFNALKIKNPNLIVGVLGCMAQRLKDNLLKEKSLVKLVVGPDSYRKIPEILDQINGSDITFIESDLDDFETYTEIYPARHGKVSAWVAIMRGCNNFCSYCIVPYLRGRERSRTKQSILAEVTKLVNEGFAEVTLLGQNVNSYRDGDTDFAGLIYHVSQVPGIKRVRFATSHPKDLSPELIRIIAAHEKICNHIHLPVQSGSNKILKLMNRNYSREHYLSLIEQIRTEISEPGLYTDVIVGFPGETEKDFDDTLDLIKAIRFDGVFSFKYSPREGTAACLLEETMSEEEKKERLDELNRIQKEFTLQRNRQLIGSIQKILIEGTDRKRKENQLMGRTDTNKIVVFPAKAEAKIGAIVDVHIKAAEGHTLFGEINGCYQTVKKSEPQS